MTNKLTVGVTGVHIATAPKSGAIVLKELLLYPSVRPIALADYPQTCALGWLDRLAEIHLVPQGILGPDALCGHLAQLANTCGLDIVIPCDDEDVFAVASGSVALRDSGIRYLLPSVDIVASVKKENLGRTLQGIGICVPRQITISDILDLQKTDIEWPVVVKGRLSHAYLARNAAELWGFVSKLSEVWGYPVVIQQFVEGSEFSVCAIADRRSHIAGMCAIRKQGISDQGKTWRAVTIAPDDFEPILNAFVSGLNWVGPVEIEFIRPINGSEPLVIEVNPRFPAWIPVSRHAGADLVKLAVNLCSGEPADKGIAAKAGMCFARTYCTGNFPMAGLAKLYVQGNLLSETFGVPL